MGETYRDLLRRLNDAGKTELDLGVIPSMESRVGVLEYVLRVTLEKLTRNDRA